MYMARTRSDLTDLIPTDTGDYLRLEPTICFPARLPEHLQDNEFNCEIELGFETFRVSSIDLEFL